MFKGGWIDCPLDWTRPELATKFETLRSLRSLVYRPLSAAREAGDLRSFTEAEVGVATDSEELYSLMRKYCESVSERGERERYSLADIFIVSRVTVEPSCEAGEESRHCEGVKRVYSESGEVVWGGDRCRVNVRVWRAGEKGRHKCPRCWLWTAVRPDQLCLRCQHVYNHPHD